MTGPGAPGTVHEWPIPSELWMIRPSQETAAQKTLAQAVRQAATAARLPVQELRCEAFIGQQGRRLELLPPEAARTLYVRCHRAHVWVTAVTGARWKLDPSLSAADRQNLAPLDDLVRCKAAGFRTVSRPAEAADFVAEAAADAAVGCTGPRDPRCLPVHVFAPGAGINLSTEEALKQFEQKYRSHSKDRKRCWIDSAGRKWETATAMHTMDQLHVAGHRLPIGFHWDVQAPLKRTILVTGWQRWEVVNGGYLNVHPDAHVRSTHARLVWDWEKPRPPRRASGRRK